MADRRPFVPVGTKLAVWLCLVLAATGMAMAMWLSNLARERLVEGKVTAATMVADLFSASVLPALDFEDQEGLAQEVAKFQKNPDIAYAGVFVPGSRLPSAEWLPNRGKRPEAPARSSTETFPDHIAVSRLLSAADGHALGSLLLHVSLAPENERFVEARKRIIEYTGIAVALFALGMLLITRRVVTTPLRQLALAARRLERGKAEAVVVRANDEVGQLGSAFNAMAAAIVDREQKLAELNRELMQLLDGMRQAILVFERGGVLGAAKSHQATLLFDTAGDEEPKIQELLYGKRTDDVGAQAFGEWLGVAFDAGIDAWSEVAELAPKEVVIEGGREERILSLDFRPIEVDGRIERIMMLASDETEKRHLERVVKERDEEHEKQMAAMRRLVAGGGQLLVSVLDRARERLAACRQIVAGGPELLDPSLLEQLFQHVHSVKGEARAFDLSILDTAAADLEDFLAILRGRLREGQNLSLSPVRADFSTRFAAAERALVRASEMLVQASPIGEAILHQVTVQREDVEELVRLAGGKRDELGKLVNRLAARPFGELLLGLAEAVPRWAVREGKRARIDVEGRKVRVPASLSRVLPDVLTHLVRNAVAHGIEMTTDRAATGKDELAVIAVAATEGPDGPVICVEDDGRGLDSGAILGRAADLGISGDDVVRLALSPGLSTADGSELAGHGVGLGAVRSDLDSVGYAMTLHSSPNGLKIVMRPREGRSLRAGGSVESTRGTS